MRLLRVDSLTFEEHFEPDVPQYAILSHRWEEEEILYADIIAGRFKHKKALMKLRYTCEQTRKDNLEFVWIDTFCIDKTSSADLSEAINSMFNWYRDAAVCYAYLSDYTTLEEEAPFTSSTWFSRGWTLQELIAPDDVKFYDKSWTFIGTRFDLRYDIQEVTQIPIDVLLHGSYTTIENALARYPAGRKMSWAARRRTTRIEDRAYSLLGLFQVNMPLLYGEGDRAFDRLQKEILRDSADLSMLAWNRDYIDDRLLAPKPNDFEDCHDLEFSSASRLRAGDNLTVSITNLGLRIDNPRVREDRGNICLLDLRCYRRQEPARIRVLELHKSSSQQGADSPETEANAKSSLYFLNSLADANGYGQLQLHIRTTEVNIFEFFEQQLLPSLTIAGGSQRRQKLEKSAVHTHISFGWDSNLTDSMKVISLFPIDKWKQSDVLFEFGTNHVIDVLENMGAIAVEDSHGNRVAVTFVRSWDSRPNIYSRYALLYGMQNYIPEKFGKFDPLLLNTGKDLAFFRYEGFWDRAHHEMPIQPSPARLCINMQEAIRSGATVARLQLTIRSSSQELEER